MQGESTAMSSLTTAPTRPDEAEPDVDDAEAEAEAEAVETTDDVIADPAQDTAADADDERAKADDADDADDGGPAGPSLWHRATGPFRRGGTERVLAVVAVLGVLGTALFAGLWITDRRADQGEAAMEAKGEEFLLALTNFDAATVDEDFDNLVDLGAGDFASEADQFFGSDVREALKEVQASSRGEVRDLYVQSFSGDRGRVFGVVDQTIANNRFPQPQADQLRVELTLEHTDGDWHVTDVLVLEAPDSGSGAATAATGATADEPAAEAPADGEGTEGS
jgi:Mce-associated membrane protein